MKFVQKDMGDAAEGSAAQGRTMREFFVLSAMTVALVVVAYFAIGLIVDVTVTRISVEREKKIFFAAEVPGQVEDERVEKLLPILEKLKTHPDVPDLNYSLRVVEHKEPNAFAFPGGKIGVTTGLLKLLEEDGDEDGEIPIAFVIGHELGHFYNRDHLRHLGRGIGTGLFMAVVFGRGGGDIITTNTSVTMDRKYSRAQEEKADRFGVLLVHHAYGETEGVTKLFEMLKDSDRIPGWAYMYLTHPDPEKRIESLEKYAATLKQGGGED